MVGITALLHTQNDALRLGRALEILYACDEILIVDHSSRDATVQIAREYGARVVEAEADASPDQYIKFSSQPWVLCLDPHESISEPLVAALFEWKEQQTALQGSSQQTSAQAFSLRIREETAAHDWIAHPMLQTRLIPRNWTRWDGVFPAHEPSAPTLEGEILRFAFP